MRCLKRTRGYTGFQGICQMLFLVCFTGILISNSVFCIGCSGEPTEAETYISTINSPVKVSTTAVRIEKSYRSVTLSGFTEPLHRAAPAARVMAQVLNAGFVEGDRVEADRVLVSLDTRDLLARKRQAEAALDTACIAYDVARLNLERMNSLQRKGTVSRHQLETAEVAHAQAKAAREAARSAIDEIDVNLSYSIVCAPFSGIIVQKMVEEGNMVAPGQSLFIIEDDSFLRIIAPVGTDLAEGLNPGRELTVRLGRVTVRGRIEGIIPSGSTEAPGLRVQLIIDNADHMFRAGTLAMVEVPLGESDITGISIPKEALVRKGRLSGAFVVAEDSSARLHWLILGDVEGEEVSVLSGLKEGGRVILSPEQAGVRDGRRVEETAR